MRDISHTSLKICTTTMVLIYICNKCFVSNKYGLLQTTLLLFSKSQLESSIATSFKGYQIWSKNLLLLLLSKVTKSQQEPSTVTFFKGHQIWSKNLLLLLFSKSQLESSIATSFKGYQIWSKNLLLVLLSKVTKFEAKIYYCYFFQR